VAGKIPGFDVDHGAGARGERDEALGTMKGLALSPSVTNGIRPVRPLVDASVVERSQPIVEWFGL
jgi:hypothetical protein